MNKSATKVFCALCELCGKTPTILMKVIADFFVTINYF
jgi:hypothetical protein